MAQTELSHDKRAEGVARLLRETQEGALQWQSISIKRNQLDTDPDDQINNVFEAQRGKWILRLYKRSFEIVPNPMRGILSPLYPSLNREDRHWSSEVVLEIIDAADISSVASQPFSGVGALVDLLEAVKRKISKSQDFLENLLGGNDE